MMSNVYVARTQFGIFLALVLIAFQVFSAQPNAGTGCDPESLKAAAPSDGYAPYSPGRYCEGLIAEQHSAPSLQIVAFSVATEPLGNSKVLALRTAPIAGLSEHILRGRNISGAVAYRFDARVKDGTPIELKVDRVASKYNLVASTLAFVGEALIDGAPVLTPVVLSRSSGSANWPKRYLITLRLSSPAASINYTLIPLAGGAAVTTSTVDGPIAVDELVSIPIDATKSGAFRLNIEVKGVAGSGNAGPTAFTRRIYLSGPSK
jgi:hypothetical protein